MRQVPGAELRRRHGDHEWFGQRCQRHRQRRHRELLGDLRTARARRDDRPAFSAPRSAAHSPPAHNVTNTGVVTWNNPPQSASGSVSIQVGAFLPEP